MAARKKPTQIVDKVIGLIRGLVEASGLELAEGPKSKSSGTTKWACYVQPKQSLRSHMTIDFEIDGRGRMYLSTTGPGKLASGKGWINFENPGTTESLTTFFADRLGKINPLEKLAGLSDETAGSH
jgi:hypothetical protein